MLPWKLRYNIIRVNLIKSFEYLKYRIKSFFGLKTLGFDEPTSLVAFELLKKYKLPKFSILVNNHFDDLDTLDINKIHANSLRIDGANFLSINLNFKRKQVKLVVGENMELYINEASKQEIEDEMIQFIQKNEILSGLEIGMKKINKLIAI